MAPPLFGLFILLIIIKLLNSIGLGRQGILTGLGPILSRLI